MVIRENELRKAPETQESTGESWKNFIAISDIEKAFDTILTASKDALVNGLFNLGGVESMRVLDLAKLIAARTELLLGNRVHVKYPRITSSSPLPRLNWKIAKFRILGWKPEKNSIPNEVDNTISYCANKFLGQ